MNALVEAIIVGILKYLVSAYRFTRTAISADRNSDLLDRAGSRIRLWMQQGRSRFGKQPDKGGTALQDKGLPPDRR